MGRAWEEAIVARESLAARHQVFSLTLVAYSPSLNLDFFVLRTILVLMALQDKVVPNVCAHSAFSQGTMRIALLEVTNLNTMTAHVHGITFTLSLLS